MLYGLLRAIAAVSLRWFYSRIDTEGLERVPAAGPLLLAVNHPNALVDALVVACVCPRRITFTGRATLFRNPALGAFLRLAGVVPLIRAKDIADMQSPADAARNAAAFSVLNAALGRGGAIMIFPEGVTGDRPALAPLRTGAARVALQAADSGVRDLAIVPVGLTFERKDAPRTRVFVQVGEKLDVARWPRAGADEDARLLTAEIEQRLRAVTLNFETIDAAERDRALAAQLARIFRGIEATPEVWQPYGPFADEVAITRRIDDARAELGRAPGPVRQRADALLERLARFRETLRAHRLVVEDLEIDVGMPPGAWFVVREGLVAAVAGPFAMWGWLNHWLPFNLARTMALWSVESAADPAMRTIVSGLGLVLLFYGVQGALVYAVFGAPIALGYLASLPIAADVNFALRARLRRVIRRARAYVRLRRDPVLREELQRELHWLRSEALAVEQLLVA